MVTSRWLFRGSLSLVLTGLALCAATPVRAQEKTAEIKKLLKERRELLDGALKIMMERYEAGTVEITDLLRVQQRALKVGLESHDDPKERLALLRRSVENAQQFVNRIDQRKKAGVDSEVNHMLAREALLEARMELLGEEQRQKPAKPAK